jgi:hypothetical protein
MAIADFVVKHGATVNELATFNSTTDATSTSSAALTVAGGVGIAKSLIVGGSINTTSTAASSVAWTTSGVNLKLPARTYTDTTSISAVPASYVNTVLAPTFASTNVITIANAANLFVDAPVAGTNSTLTNAWAIYANGRIRASDFTGTIGVTTASSGAFTTLSASGQITSTLAIGTAPFVVTSTTNVANLNASSLSGATFAAPGAIGSTTASTGKFTTVESTVATGTAPFIVASTTNVANLNASLLNGSTFAAPSAIGSTTANTGTFTTLSTTGNLTIGGNLTVNGTTVTLNSSTITVDDKNLELGSVATVLPTGNITAGSAIVTNLSSTANIIIGSAVSAISGAVNVTLPASVTVLTVDSATQITLSAVFTGTGSATGATLTIGGASNITANSGGITLKGATDKTIIWDSTNSNWTSSENWNIVTGNTYKINNVPVLTANSVLNDATQTSVTVGGNATTLNLGAVGSGNTYVNTSSLYVGGATLLTTASAGIEVGSGRTGDGFAFIDLVGDATYTDYGARFVRSGTANGLTKIVTRGTGGLVLETNEAGSISFNTSATTRMTIDSSGKVLIGTTSAYTVGVSSSLQVHGTNANAYVTSTRWSANVSGSGYIFGKSRGAAVGTRAAVVVNDVIGESSFYGDDATNFVFAASITGVVDTAVSTGVVPGRLMFTTASDTGVASERMRIDSSGNVGIGVTPTARLQVVGSKTISAQANVAAVIGANTTSDLLLGSLNGNAPFIASQGAYPLLMYTNATEKMRINSDGNVGIGSVAGSDSAFQVNKPITTGTSGYAIRTYVSVPSNISNAHMSFDSSGYTSAAGFTLSNYSHYSSSGLTLGAGSVVTNQTAFSATISGATSNFGFYGGLSAPVAGGASNAITSLTVSGTVATFTATGHTFVATQVVTISFTIPITAITIGMVVTIVAAGTVPGSWTTVGASSNAVGTSFTATAAGTGLTGGGTVTINAYNGSAKTIATVATNTFTVTVASATLGATAITGTATASTSYNLYMLGTAPNYINGNTGIGTNLPLAKLHVKTASAVAGEQVIFENGTNVAYSTLYMLLKANGLARATLAGQQDNTSNGGIFVLQVADSAGTSTERLRVDASGNCSIKGTFLEVRAADTGVRSRIVNSSSEATRYPGFEAFHYSGNLAGTLDNGGFPVLEFFRSRGTEATKIAVSSGDYIASVTGWGWDGTGQNDVCRMNFLADNTLTAADARGRIEFQTQTGTTLSTAMTIKSDGSVGIGTTSPSYKLDVVTTGVRFQSGTSETAIFLGPQTNAGYVYGNSTAIGFYSGTTGANIALNKDTANVGVFISSGTGSYQIVFDTASTRRMTIFGNGNVAIGTVTDSGYKLQVNGSFAATTKSFVIDHPTKPDMKLRYGSLEGPENGVYIRGRLKDSNVIELPDYWTGLVDESTITVNLTAIGKSQDLWVDDIIDNTVIVGGSNVNCFYTVFAERKDVEKLIVEF